MACTYRPAPISPTEAMARILVAAIIPALEAAMTGGLTYGQAMADARRVYEARWLAEHGPDVARRAAEILYHVGPAAILTDYGRRLFLEEYPLSAMPRDVPRPLNDNTSHPPTQPGGIGRRWTKALADLFRVPPAAG